MSPGRCVRLVWVLALLALAPLAALAQVEEKPEVRVGVLAYRGEAHARAQWGRLVKWLNERLPAYHFRLVPMTLDSARELLSRNQVDFLITNPGHYVALAKRFPLSPLATLVRTTPEGVRVMRFGSVIFTRADNSAIGDLADVKGKTVAAVSREAFGGFLVGWREFRRLGVDLLRDVNLYLTGFPQDRIVQAVLSGRADVGIVRTGLLEALARAGKLDMKKIRILHPVPHEGFPWKVSSRLYPEWPFVVSDGVDRTLASRVQLALLQTMDSNLRLQTGCKMVWAAPLSYRSVRALLDEFAAAQWQRDGARLWLGLLALLALLAAAFAIAWAWRSRRVEKAMVAAMPNAVAEEELDRFADLTRRELQVLACLCEGLSSKEIAKNLGISPKTVEFHRANLLKKTGFSSTTRMVSVAVRLGLDSCPGKTREKPGNAPNGAGKDNDAG